MFGRYDQAQAYLQQAMDELEQDNYIDNGGTNASGPGRWIYAWSELAITWQLMGRLEEAARAWSKMYMTAKRSGTETNPGDWLFMGAYGRLECMCRAVGNEGVVKYLLAVEAMERVGSMDAGDPEGEGKERVREEVQRLLRAAAESLKERIQLAVQVREGHGDVNDERVVEDGMDIEVVRKKYQARAWQIIGYSRLSLAYSAIAAFGGSDVDQGHMRQLSIQTAQEGVRLARSQKDSTVTALAHFYYGKALLADDQPQQALKHLNLDPGFCTPAIALCKQPSAEHRAYLRELVDLGVDLNLLDEHGYSAMDYAVFVGDAEAESILVAGLKSQFGDDGQKVALLQEGARLRKGYRELFQEQLRPVLLESGGDCLHKLRSVYAEALDTDAEKRRMFDHLKHLSYADFVNFGRLPRSSDGLHKPFTPATDDGSYIIFFSYRWINKDPALRSPDDTDNTQYKRMIDAVELFLQEHPEVDQEKLCIWMVSHSFASLIIINPARQASKKSSGRRKHAGTKGVDMRKSMVGHSPNICFPQDFACVDQDNPSAGVAALPMILAQCDAVISLVDDEYYDRAWCSVEVLLIQTLQRAYGVHKWYEHVLLPGPPGSEGEYTEGKLVDAGRPVKRWNLLCPILQKDINMAEKKLSLESDRPRVMFLERQSRLLG